MPRITERTPRKKKPVVKKTEHTHYDKEVGTVTVEKGVTKNMGDFNSSKVTVGITIPVGADDEYLKRVGETLKVAHETIDQEIENQVDEMLAS